MFVLPPPPKFPSASQLGAAGGHLIETNNVLSNPVGSEFKLVAGEGTYVLRDDLFLATPLPHPTEAPAQNPNPLATTPVPASAGTRLSLTILKPSRSSLRGFERSIHPNGSKPPLSITKQDGLSDEASDPSESGSAIVSHGANEGAANKPPAFGAENPSLSANVAKDLKDPLKRRKPKSNIVKSNSSFVSRVMTHDALVRRLQEHNPAGVFAFANVNRAMQWLDLSSELKAEHLTKILFTKAHPLCHDVNSLTKCSSHLDVVMGFSTGDIIWYEPFSQKYGRINKNGAINESAVSDIRWVPGSENLFLASHIDGTLVVYDKERDDTGFLNDELSMPRGSSEAGDRSALHVIKSVQSRNQKANPVAVWKVLNHKINSFAFSPDCRHLAVVAEDGSLRIVDYLEERLLDVYMSYYGGMISVCWSPDGRYVVTGSQDDLVSIWSLDECSLVARCQGHHSWVTAVAFDPWRCDERNYRFGSVGEDCRLLLWDFSVGMLHRPRAASVRRRSVSAPSNRLRSTSSLAPELDGEREVFHAVQPRAETAMLPPVMAKAIDEHPLSWLSFEEDCIITTCKEGHIRTWNRPNEGCASKDDVPSVAGSNV